MKSIPKDVKTQRDDQSAMVYKFSSQHMKESASSITEALIWLLRWEFEQAGKALRSKNMPEYTTQDILSEVANARRVITSEITRDWRRERSTFIEEVKETIISTMDRIADITVFLNYKEAVKK